MRKPITALCGAGPRRLRRRRRGRHPGRLRRSPHRRRLHRPLLLQRRDLHLRQPGRHGLEGDEGSFQGVDLAGLSVAAAVKGTTTFSEDKPEQARAVLIVDEKADSRQREALVALARSLGGDRLGNVVDVKATTISLKIEGTPRPARGRRTRRPTACPTPPAASFWAAGLAQIVTRPLDDGDHFCGNEVVAYAAALQGRRGPAGLHPRPPVQGRRPRHHLGRPELPEQLRRPASPFDRLNSRIAEGLNRKAPTPPVQGAEHRPPGSVRRGRRNPEFARRPMADRPSTCPRKAPSIMRPRIA